MGAVTVMVPVATAQVGWVRETDGAAGVEGCALIVALVPEEIQPSGLLAVTLYKPVATPENVALVW